VERKGGDGMGGGGIGYWSIVRQAVKSINIF